MLTWHLVLIYILMLLYMYIAPKQGQTTPWGQMLMTTENPYPFANLLQVYKNWFEVQFYIHFFHVSPYEPPHDKTNKMACAPSEDSDQPGHPPGIIRVFAVSMKKAWVLSYPLTAQRRLWSDCTDTQADQSIRWAHMPFCWFCHKAAQLYI